MIDARVKKKIRVKRILRQQNSQNWLAPRWIHPPIVLAIGRSLEGLRERVLDWWGSGMEVRNVGDSFPHAPWPASSAKQPKPLPNPIDTASISRRLQKELMALMMSSDAGVSAFPEGENIFSWIGTIEGSKGTPYEGLSYKLSLKFPLDYPFKPPQVKFETPCFHPNIDQCGNICLDILQDMWSSAYDCRTILLSIQSLLGEPNNESPLNSFAAAMWNDQEDYTKMVHKQYVSYGEVFEC